MITWTRLRFCMHAAPTFWLGQQRMKRLQSPSLSSMSYVVFVSTINTVIRRKRTRSKLISRSPSSGKRILLSIWHQVWCPSTSLCFFWILQHQSIQFTAVVFCVSWSLILCQFFTFGFACVVKLCNIPDWFVISSKFNSVTGKLLSASVILFCSNCSESGLKQIKQVKRWALGWQPVSVPEKNDYCGKLRLLFSLLCLYLVTTLNTDNGSDWSLNLKFSWSLLPLPWRPAGMEVPPQELLRSL